MDWSISYKIVRVRLLVKSHTEALLTVTMYGAILQPPMIPSDWCGPLRIKIHIILNESLCIY